MNPILAIFIIISACFTVSRADEAIANDTTAVSPSTGPFQCYVCTSVQHPGCADEYEGSDKFPHEKLLNSDLYVRSCDEKDVLPYVKPGDPEPTAVGCRKILQEVEDKTRVVRQCAYSKPEGDEDEVKGLKRTGNEGVRLYYYQCPKEKCNGAATVSITWVLTLIAPLMLWRALAA